MNRETENVMTGEAPVMEAAQEVSAAELGAEMTEEADAVSAGEEAQEREALEAAVREGIAQLFEDGWTAQELAAFSQDGAAREAIAAGKSVARAACAYIRAKGAVPRKGGVPTARTIATGGFEQGNPIDRMTDEEFDAFSRRARAAMMEGRKVRI